MSFLGTGLVGNMLGTMLGGALDSVLSGDMLAESPIPSFYFEVDFFEVDNYSSASLSLPGDAPTGLAALGANLSSAAMGMVTGPNTLQPGEYDKKWTEKAFIEVSGIELGIENDQKQEGGNNFPINLPGKMKNQPVVLKRLVRKKTINDKWDKWVLESLESAAYWNSAIKRKIIQINVMHPNLGDGGKPFILSSIELFDAYPTKFAYGTLSSTSEDLLTQEIEVTYSQIKIVSP